MLRILFILLFFNSSAFCDIVGGYPGSSFRYGTNARAIALGSSLLSNYNNGFNAFSNPALLSKIKTKEYGVSYFPMSLDRSIQVISLSNALPPSAGMSLSFVKSGTDDIIVKDNANNNVGNTSQSESYGLMSFGTYFGKLSLGINLKAVFNNLAKEFSSKGIGFDIGLLYSLNDKINIGLMMKDLNTKYIWDDINNNIYEEKFPSIYSLGFDYRSTVYSLFSQYDIISVEDKQFEEMKTGLEIDLNKTIFTFPLFIRLGYKSSTSNNTFGFGFPFEINNKLKLVFDYAIDLGKMEEGVSHLISFSIRGNN